MAGMIARLPGTRHQTRLTLVLAIVSGCALSAHAFAPCPVRLRARCGSPDGVPVARTAPAMAVSSVSLRRSEAMHAAAVQASKELFISYEEPPAAATEAYTWHRYSFAGADNEFQGTDATPPPPFRTGDLARVSREPLLTRDECDAIIQEAENDYYGFQRGIAR